MTERWLQAAHTFKYRSHDICDAFHMFVITPSHVIVRVFLPWAVNMACNNVFCSLCHSKYQYLTPLIRPFILMEFTRSLPVSSLEETELFAWAVGGAERQIVSNKFVVVGRPCCHFPFLKVIKSIASKIQWLILWEDKIITLQNYHFHLCFSCWYN